MVDNPSPGLKHGTSALKVQPYSGNKVSGSAFIEHTDGC